MKKRLQIVSLFLCLCISAWSQREHVIDSLQHLLNSEQSDTQRVNLMNHLADNYRFSDPAKHMEYAKQALALAHRTNFQRGLANAYNMVGTAMENGGRFDAAIDYYDSSLTLYTSLGNSNFIARLNLNIANVYQRKREYKTATQYAMTSLRKQEELHNNFGVAVTNLTLGNIAFSEDDAASAVSYYEVAYRLNRISEKNLSLEASALANIGACFKSLHQPDSSMHYFRLALSLAYQAGDSAKIGTGLNNIGVIWAKKENYDSALYYHRKALSMDYRMNNPYAAIKALSCIGNAYQDLKKGDSALFYYNKALALARSVNVGEDVANVYFEMANTFEIMGDLKSALKYQRLYQEYADSLREADQVSSLFQVKQAYELDKKDQQLQVSESAKQLAEEHDRRNTQLFIIFGCLAVFVIIIMLVMYRNKRKNNSLLEKRNSEILAHQEEITSSIHYAKRIQEAIFPSKEVKYRLFPDAFVMLLPRDIVSGDFYWFAEHSGKKLIAAVDCTGHGVPGAFMSMIGNAFLNEIVNEKGNTDAAKILDELRDMVITSLKQTGQDEDSKDGMDISLVVIDEKNSTIQYAGANNPIWLCRKNSMEMEEVKADKQPIGFYSGAPKPFTGHTIKVSKGDSFYIFTDGFADQFGGKDGKKFRYKPLTELFINVNAEPMQTQEKILRDTFAKWKGELEQVDDVLVIGVRV